MPCAAEKPAPPYAGQRGRESPGCGFRRAAPGECGLCRGTVQFSGALRRMRALRGARVNSRRDGVRPACAEGRSASRRCAFESICHPTRGLLWEESGESIPKRLKTVGFLS